MPALKNINLAVRFGLELCMLAALGYGAYHTFEKLPLLAVIAALGLPVCTAVFWGLFLSPKAKVKLHLALRVVLELVLFAAAALLLYHVGQVRQGVALIVTFIINRLILLAVKADERVTD